MNSVRQLIAAARASRIALRKRLAILAVASLLGAGFMIAGPAISASAVSCTGYACVGHDPLKYGCSISVTATTDAYYNGVQVAWLWNRYSKACNANWSEAQLTTAGLNAGDSLTTDIWTMDTNGNYEFMCFPGPSNTGTNPENCSSCSYGACSTTGNGNFIYTDMVDGTKSTTAGVVVLNSGHAPIADVFANN
jgi:hypothetical protein